MKGLRPGKSRVSCVVSWESRGSGNTTATRLISVEEEVVSGEALSS